MQLKLNGARADEIQGYVDKNDMKNFYSNLKDIYGPTSASSSPLLSADGTKFISEEQDSEEVGWAFLWYTKQDIYHHEWVTWCHSNPGGSSDSYPSTIQQQSTRIWLNSCGNL